MRFGSKTIPTNLPMWPTMEFAAVLGGLFGALEKAMDKEAGDA